MRTEKVSLKMILDTRRKKTSDEFPIKLRITYNRRRKYYGVGYDATPREWEMITGNTAKGKLRKLRHTLNDIEKNAQETSDSIHPFSFSQFENEFFEDKMTFQTLESAYLFYMEKLKANNQFGTADSYKAALTSLQRFKPHLKLEQVDVKFLQAYEKWMLCRGKSITTVGIYLRTLRAILNLAKEEGIIRPEAYPFGKRKYIIPTGKNVKRALNIEQVAKLFNYPAEPGSACEKARDFWIFSYLCNGINMKDIAFLKWKNVDTETITFERAKTANTKRSDPPKIMALRNKKIDEIINKWGNPYKSKDSFLFHIIRDGDSLEIAEKRVAQFIKDTNKWLKQIGKELNFDLKLTTYVARHSFATILVRGGAPLEMASQALGHSNLSTTQKYFAGFDLDKQAEFTKALTDF